MQVRVRNVHIRVELEGTTPNNNFPTSAAGVCLGEMSLVTTDAAFKQVVFGHDKAQVCRMVQLENLVRRWKRRLLRSACTVARVFLQQLLCTLRVYCVLGVCRCRCSILSSYDTLPLFISNVCPPTLHVVNYHM